MQRGLQVVGPSRRPVLPCPTGASEPPVRASSGIPAVACPALRGSGSVASETEEAPQRLVELVLNGQASLLLGDCLLTGVAFCPPALNI